MTNNLNAYKSAGQCAAQAAIRNDEKAANTMQQWFNLAILREAECDREHARHTYNNAYRLESDQAVTNTIPL
jgi:hypothetical protein